MTLAIGRPDDPAGPAVVATSARVEGPGRLLPVVSGPALGHGLVELGPGGVLRWPEAHGEEALVVLEGSVDHEGRVVPVGGAVVVHGGGPLGLVAPTGARLAHFWSHEGHREASDPAEVHLLGPGGRARSSAPGGSQAVWFADSTCPGCRVTLMRVWRDEPDHRGRPHTHTADEVIAVVEGEVAFGARRLGVGDAAHIPGGLRYAVTSGPHGHAFVNFRAGPSEQRYADDGRPEPEHAAARGGVEVGDLIG